METLPDATPVKSLEEWADMLQPVHNFLGSSIRPKLPGLAILNVTQMTSQRKDGHLSVYLSPSGPVPLHRQDCSHWCLPGVPDTWNELVCAVFKNEDGPECFSRYFKNIEHTMTKILDVGYPMLAQ